MLSSALKLDNLEKQRQPKVTIQLLDSRVKATIIKNSFKFKAIVDLKETLVGR